MFETLEIDGDIDFAGVTLGVNPLKVTPWPPPKQELETDTSSQRRALDRLEGRRGGSAGAEEVPPLERWPFYGVDLADIPVLDLDAPELKDYRVMLSMDIKQAFLLAARWQQFNAGRSLGFTEMGAAKLSSAKVAVPVLMRQLQGLSVFKGWVATGQGEEADFERFLEMSGADEKTANELRSVAIGLRPGHGAQTPAPKLQDIQVDAFLGTDNGSALAVWALEPESESARVEFLIGEDCMAQGPEAESALLRLLAGRAGALGARRLRCRARFTEDGQFFAPLCFNAFGLQRIVVAGWDDGYEEDTGEMEGLLREIALREEGESIVAGPPPEESVPGLFLWLSVQGLNAHIDAANAWCEEMGAATLEEVIDAREDLADSLGERLSSGERQGLLERSY